MSELARLLEERERLLLTLADAVARLTLDRTDTRALGFPESREERDGRALLAELSAGAPLAAPSAASPASALPPALCPPGGAS